MIVSIVVTEESPNSAHSHAPATSRPVSCRTHDIKACVIGWSSRQAETSKQQTDAKLRYFDRLMTRDYIQHLWEIEEFTPCFESAAKSHLSYFRFDEVRRQDDAYKTAARWWVLVENDQKELEGCGKRRQKKSPNRAILRSRGPGPWTPPQSLVCYLRLSEIRLSPLSVLFSRSPICAARSAHCLTSGGIS
jgi:hypothetical protein